MFGPLGFPELIFILVLALLIFGPKRLPEIGRTIGRGMAEFRKASTDLKRTINTELALDEPAAPPVRPWIEPPAVSPATPATPANTAPRSPYPGASHVEAETADLTEPWMEPDDTPAPAVPANEPLEPS
ncbi:MAG TPA: twin-arginine translocase TatA/TatE family subunit [Thermoanaerobaculia bacterium]|nr:twin-arginine translocase TatA/TatE family subunit [Thermoanaerobaculia bacterium]